MLLELLENIPFNIRRDMWFLHDGATSHFRRDYFNKRFPQRWIGRGGVIARLKSILSGYIRQRVYDSAVDAVEELRNRIHAATGNLHM